MIENSTGGDDSKVLDRESKTWSPPNGERRRRPPGGLERPSQVTLAVVLQVRGERLRVLLWKRAKEPFARAWSLPGGYLGQDETLEQSIRRQLATKVDVGELSWLEQLETLSEPDRHPREWQLATAYLGLIPRDLDPGLPPDTRWHPVDGLPRMAFDHQRIVLAGRERLRAKLSYTNIGFALAPERFSISELRSIYTAALGYPTSATNLRRVLERRGVLEVTDERRPPGPEGGRPAALYRFSSRKLQVTDPFAVLRPPGVLPRNASPEMRDPAVARQGRRAPE
jgi:ADP-ribose pyrophosphatase YjhB (NUDIX family)